MGLAMNRVYHPSSPLAAIKAEANAATVDFLDGTDHAAALAAARKADVVVVLAEQWRAEGQDMQGLNLADGQDALIESVATANPKTIVVLESGGPVAMPWLAKVPAVIAAFYPGSGGGEAIAGVLFGRVNPSGHLPLTFPASVAQLPHPEQRDPATTTSNPGMKTTGGVFHVDYNVEGADVGYRWFARKGLTPLFPFGHGLSYTSFRTSDLSAREQDGTVTARFTVTNTGARAGADVPQLYVAKPGTDGFVTRLAGFKRVSLAPGESAQVEVKVDARVLAHFNATKRQWRIAAGAYQVRLAADALDAGLSTTVDLPESVFHP
jgi:beta-glucosidase